jgi:hypothetical protein
MFYFVDHHIISHLIIHVYLHILIIWGFIDQLLTHSPPNVTVGLPLPQMHMFSVVAGLTADAEHAVQGASE